MFGSRERPSLSQAPKPAIITRRKALLGLGAAVSAPAIIKSHSALAWGSHGAIPVPAWASHKTTKIYDPFKSFATIDRSDSRAAGKLWYPANNWEIPIVGSPPLDWWWGKTTDAWAMHPTPDNGQYFDITSNGLLLPKGYYNTNSGGTGFSISLSSIALNSGAPGGYVGWTLGGGSTSGFSLSFLSRFDQSKANGNESPGVWSFGGLDFYLGLTPLATEVDWQEVFNASTPQSIHDWNFNYAYDPTVGSNFNPFNTKADNDSAFGWCNWGVDLVRTGGGFGTLSLYRNNVQSGQLNFSPTFLPLLDSQKVVVHLQAAQLAPFELRYFWAGET